MTCTLGTAAFPHLIFRGILAKVYMPNSEEAFVAKDDSQVFGEVLSFSKAEIFD